MWIAAAHYAGARDAAGRRRHDAEGKDDGRGSGGTAGENASRRPGDPGGENAAARVQTAARQKPAAGAGRAPSAPRAGNDAIPHSAQPVRSRGVPSHVLRSTEPRSSRRRKHPAARPLAAGRAALRSASAPARDSSLGRILMSTPTDIPPPERGRSFRCFGSFYAWSRDLSYPLVRLTAGACCWCTASRS